MTIRRGAIIGGALALALALGGGAWWWAAAAREAARTLVFSIPPGTVERLAAGEEVEVFPQTIELALSRQDTLVIRNDDRQTVTIGPFRIEPGQRFTQRYYNPGTYELVCTIHQGQQLRIVVEK